MFEHENFDILSFNEIPLNTDCIVMDEIYIDDYEQSLVGLFSGSEYEPVGYVSFASCRKINENSIELSWYPNTYDRFHEVSITMPKNKLVICVSCWRYDEDPHLFVKSEWLENLYSKLYSVFCLTDAIGVKKALENGELTRKKLVNLRDKIDHLARSYLEISFISLADNILLKSNWTVGSHKNEVKYTYKPEIFVEILTKLQEIYKDILNLDMYAILTQGSNEYYEDELLHISETNNHISLNSLGVPFSDLLSIEDAVRNAIKNKRHKPAQLYMDQKFYNSLNLKYEFKERNNGKYSKYSYISKMETSIGYYYLSDFETIKSNLDNTGAQKI